MYVSAWLLCYVFWTYAAGAHRNPEPWISGFFASLLSACGLLSWVLIDHFSWHFVFVASPVIWAGWLLLVSKLRLLRNLPYVVHLFLGILWWCSGCPPAGLVIT